MAKEIVFTTDYSLFINNDFKNEKELKEYIISNIDDFCNDVLKIQYKSHDIEFPIKPILKTLHDNTLFIDLLITDTNNYIHLIELKCPKNAYLECMMGLGQCLSYYYLSRCYNFKLGGVYLISAKHCNLIPLVIRDNNLKIKYIYYSKNNYATT